MKTTSDRRRSFWDLSWEEQSVVMQTVVGVLATKVGLRLLGFNRCQKLFESRAPRQDFNAGKVSRIAHLSHATAQRMIVETNCLERSLTLWWLLRRRGFAGDLRIGARKEMDRFEAHAWVECSGRVFNEDGGVHQHFVPFESIAHEAEKD